MVGWVLCLYSGKGCRWPRDVLGPLLTELTDECHTVSSFTSRTGAG